MAQPLPARAGPLRCAMALQRPGRDRTRAHHDELQSRCRAGADAVNPLKRILARRRLKRSLKPDPAYRARKLAQFSPERRDRYWRNVEGLS